MLSQGRSLLCIEDEFWQIREKVASSPPNGRVSPFWGDLCWCCWKVKDRCDLAHVMPKIRPHLHTSGEGQGYLLQMRCGKVESEEMFVIVEGTFSCSAHLAIPNAWNQWSNNGTWKKIHTLVKINFRECETLTTLAVKVIQGDHG